MDRHPGFPADLDHVVSPAAARKGDDDLWFAGPQHFSVADRTGSQAMRLPVCGHWLAWNPTSLGPFACEPISPARRPMNQEREAVGAVQIVENPEKALTI